MYATITNFKYRADHPSTELSLKIYMVSNALVTSLVMDYGCHDIMRIYMHVYNQGNYNSENFASVLQDQMSLSHDPIAKLAFNCLGNQIHEQLHTPLLRHSISDVDIQHIALSEDGATITIRLF